MIVTAEMKVKDVLNINEDMMEALVWVAPEFERLREPGLRRAIADRFTVAQAARMGQLPLTEALYVLNLMAGEGNEEITGELEAMPPDAFNYRSENPPRKPHELTGLADTDPRVRFVDVTRRVERSQDIRPPIMRGLMELREPDDVLLVHHRFDPIQLRDLFGHRGFSSWAEERSPGDWYVYFYRPEMPRPQQYAGCGRRGASLM